MSDPTAQTDYGHRLGYSHDRILAPVPLRRGQPVPGYFGFHYRADGSVAPGTFGSSCANSFGPAYGRPEPIGEVDPGTVSGGPFYNLATCPSEPCGCLDPNSWNYTPNATCHNQKRCVYPSGAARDECSAGGALPCTRGDAWKHSHD